MKYQKYNGLNVTYMGLYPAVYNPTHIRANCKGLVYVHILVAEAKLGRYLTEDECVHHVDNDKSNYDENNIWIFKSQNDHARYHECIKYNNNYVLVYQNGVYSCYSGEYCIDKILKRLNTTKYKTEICPVCGKTMSNKAKMCRKCYDKQRHNVLPDINTLLQDFKILQRFVRMGKKYNVSDNAVRKWFKYYGLPVKTQELNEYIKIHKI